MGQRLGEWSSKYGSSATRVKHYVAKGVKWYSRLGVGEFLMEAGELCVGDEVVVTGPTTARPNPPRRPPLPLGIHKKRVIGSRPGAPA